MIMHATWPARLTRLGLATVLGIGWLALAFGPALAQDRPGRPDRQDPPQDRPRDPARADRDRGDSKEIDDARAAVEKARQIAKEAMGRLMQAEARLAKLEGRPFTPPGRTGSDPFRAPIDRGAGNRDPGERIPPVRETGDRRPIERNPGDRAPGSGPDQPMEPRRPGAARAPGADLKQLQLQIEALRRALEEMRREIRRGNGNRSGSDDRGKDPKRSDSDNRPDKP